MKIVFYSQLLLFFLCLSSETVGGQSNPDGSFSGPNFDYSNSVSLEEVTFWKPLPGDGEWIVIRNDLDDFSISGVLSTEAWNKNGGAKPVAYVSGSTARLSATFDIICNGPAGQKFYAKAEHPGGYQMPVKELIEFGGKWLYLESSMDQAFPQAEVGFWDDFELTWYLSNIQIGPWGEVDTSQHPLNVTHGSPLLSSTTKAFHTILYLGCKNAVVLDAKKLIVRSIYTEFQDQSVRRVGSNNDMTYWRPSNPAPEPACFTTAGLLRYEDSRCGAWANLFRDMILVQGIPSVDLVNVDWHNPLSGSDANQLSSDLNTFFAGEPNTSQFSFIEPFPRSNQILGILLVKSWDFTSSIGPTGGSGGNNKFFIHETDPNGVASITIANGNSIRAAELNGIPGQGNPDPQSFFVNHAMVKYDGSYFDPSYGSPPQSSGNDWENASLDGFGTFFFYERIENNMLRTYDILWNGHLNTSVQQTTIMP